ncbi:hypothetical protein NG54_12440 [Heyndrickxia ginsengihumi]|uniref:Uncharacterized protein n=1 Tax=Heyndrickxia ginsengihumi TaxID=363870 RepID=A0A0A6VBS1_9BACI|nr:hypothetical protein NG54_12440 [Heyndrickxia ginsengihumi]
MGKELKIIRKRWSLNLNYWRMECILLRWGKLSRLQFQTLLWKTLSTSLYWGKFILILMY